MSLQIQDYLAKRPPSPSRPPRHEAAIVHVSETVKTVTTHPGWQMFLAHVETLTQRATDARNAEKDGAISNPDPLQREAARQEALRLTGYLQGIRDATDLVPELIRRGDQATERLLAEP